MIKKLCFFLLVPIIGYSQSLTVSVESSTAGNQYTTFGLSQQNVTFSGNGIRFAGGGETFGDYTSYGVTADYSVIGVLKNTIDGPKTFLLSASADTLASYNTISISYSDPSLAVYPLSSGEVLLRNNIANFTLYNPLGSIATSGSSGSQSQGGESISEVASDPNGKTIVAYTPKIKQGNQVGSQALLLNENSSTENIYYSEDRQIKYAGVSDNGQFIVLITARTGTDDQVMVLDRYGNRLNAITSEEDLVAAHFTEENDQLLLYSRGRALVYSTLGGERVGSTSFRSPLLLAQYFSDDQTIIGLTGSKVENTKIYRDIEFHAVNLKQREIARSELSGALGTSPNIELQFLRRGSGRYRLQGANKIINLRARF